MSLFDQISSQHYTETPRGWTTRRIKHVADVQTSNVDKVTSDDEEAVRLCNYTDVYYNDRITPDLPFMEATATQKEIERFALRAGQVIITKDSEGWDDIGIPALVSEDMPGTLCGYHLAIFSPNQDHLDGGFFAWLCRADALNDQFKLSANGVTRFGLGQYAMKNAIVGLPPVQTQKRIAAFLDEKTTQINGLIEKKRALLKRLAEKRQAIITQAVTKGLDPGAPMKESGIDWLGPLPAHWDVKRLKHLRRYLTSGSRGWGEFYADDGAPFLRMTNVTKPGVELDLSDLRYVQLNGVSEGTRTATQPGDVLITITAELGAVAIVRSQNAGAYINQHLALFRPDPVLCDPDFLVNFLWSDLTKEQFLLSGQGGTKQGLGFDQVNDVIIALPPRVEQQDIAVFVNCKRAEIDRAEALIDRSTTKLAEYRSALITAAVTGQIEGLR